MDAPGSDDSRLTQQVGLSIRHICTEPQHGVRDDAGARMASVEIWDGGSLVVVHEHAGGSRVRALRGIGEGEAPPDEEEVETGERARRGKVTEFSRRSRMRLMRLVRTLRHDAAPETVFCTLTLSDKCDTSGPAVKMYLRRLKARLARRFARVSLIWRLELKPRKSGSRVGDVFAHIHVLMFGVARVLGFKRWLSRTWYECCGSGDEAHLRAGTNVQRPRNWQHVRDYLAKREMYLGKPGDAELAERMPDMGRYWGVLNDEFLPIAEVVVRYLSPRECYRLLRVLRGYVRAQYRSQWADGHSKWRKPPGGVHRWRSFFVDDGAQWAERVDNLI